MEKLVNSYENIREDYISTLAREKFGIKYLYPWQRFVIACILDAYEYQTAGRAAGQGVDLAGDMGLAGGDAGGGDCCDSYSRGRQIVLLPTGAGKSLCFQLPAMEFPGPTLVIYPLLALMTDQQRRMEEGNLGCVVFRGGMTQKEIDENFRRLGAGASGAAEATGSAGAVCSGNTADSCSGPAGASSASTATCQNHKPAKIIIANPEVLKNESLLVRLCEVGISHIAIDEAHCCSEWGDSFRPAYLELTNVIKKINPPVVTAFTATASPTVLSRVAEILFEGRAHVVRSESDRKNICYYVRYAAEKKVEALYLAKTERRPMIIFCGTRDKSEDMARELNLCFGDGCAKFYHAGLERAEKEAVEKWFYESRDGVLTATCAYGMGVDKKDIKTVVHLEASATAEAYIQEAGRGGRDGSVAKAFLIWSPADSARFGEFAAGSRQAAMREFAESGRCRRQVLLDALGAEQAVCSGCDICTGDEGAHEVDWKTALSYVKKSPHFYTEHTLNEQLYSTFNYRYKKVLGLNVWTHVDCADLTSQLLMTGKIRKANFLWKDRLLANSSG